MSPEAKSPEQQAHAPRCGIEDDAGANPASHASRILSRDLAEIKEYVAYYLSAKLDSLKVSIRTALLYAALGVVGAIVGTGILVTAAVLIVVGIGQGLTRLFGGYAWLGNLVAGVGILILVGLAAWLAVKKLTGTWRSRTIDAYEKRKREQRERFGQDVHVRAEQKRAQAGHGQ